MSQRFVSFLKCLNMYLKSEEEEKLLTAVDSRDAKVISKFPLRPRSAGTKIKTSVTFLNTSQCYTKDTEGNTELKDYL